MTTSRPLAVARMQLLNLHSQAGLPWVVLSVVFAGNWAIFALILGAVEEARTFALCAIYLTAMASYLVTMTQTFPFVLGLSITRRDFFLGTTLLMLVQSLVSGIALTLLLAVENATDGWGVGLDFFGLPFLVQDNWFAQVLVYTVPFVFINFVSILVGTIAKRWGPPGVWTLSLGTLAAAGGAAVLVTGAGGWGAIGRFFVETPPLGLFAGYPAALAVLAAGASFLIMRRATP